MVASVWYIATTTVLSAGQCYVERHYARGTSRSLPASPPQRLHIRPAAVRARLHTVTAPGGR